MDILSKSQNMFLFRCVLHVSNFYLSTNMSSFLQNRIDHYSTMYRNEQSLLIILVLFLTSQFFGTVKPTNFHARGIQVCSWQSCNCAEWCMNYIKKIFSVLMNNYFDYKLFAKQIYITSVLTAAYLVIFFLNMMKKFYIPCLAMQLARGHVFGNF